MYHICCSVFVLLNLVEDFWKAFGYKGFTHSMPTYGSPGQRSSFKSGIEVCSVLC